MKYLINRFFYRLKNDGVFATLRFIWGFITKKNSKINLDEINISSKENMDQLFLIFGTDKGKLDGKKTYYKICRNSESRHQFKNYREWVLRKNIYDYNYEMGQNFVSIYEKFFEPIKDKNLNILEIGVANGHSHAAWYKYFTNSNIYGIDIRDKKSLLYSGKRLFYYQLDCTNINEVKKFKNNNKNLSFDIIIDDSLHNYQGFIGNLNNFFPLLKNGGYYFLEDFATSDNRLIRQREFNKKNGKSMQLHNLNMKEIFEFLSNREIFQSDYFSKNHQVFLHKNVKKIEKFYLEFPESSLALLTKND
jgi:hypothetical protein